MSDQTYVGILVVEHCYNCGIPFGMDADYQRRRIERRDNFYCPNGHAQHYLGKTDAEKAREEAQAARSSAEFHKQRAEDARRERDAARRSAAASRGVVTRVKRRLGKGVCPCCNRYFRDLHQHMSTKHTDWTGDTES